MSDAEARQVVVRLGDHDLTSPYDQSIDKQAKLIVKNKLFSMQTLVSEYCRAYHRLPTNFFLTIYTKGYKSQFCVLNFKVGNY